jgi:hypothetical protein
MQPTMQATTVARHDPRSWWAYALLAGLGLAGLVLGHPAGGDFAPRPDALEYVASAQAINDNGTYYLQIGPLRIRPRYAPGWPLILAGALRLGVPATDLWRLNAGLGALLALLIARAAERLAGLVRAPAAPRSATAPLVAGLLWLGAPVPIWLATTTLSDLAATVAVLTALGLPTLALLTRRPLGVWQHVCPAALGVAWGLRPVVGILAAPALLLLLAPSLRAQPRRWLSTAVLAGAFPLACVVLLWRSGLDPTRLTAYDLWIPKRYAGLSTPFGLSAESALFVLRALLGLPGLRAAAYVGRWWPLVGWAVIALVARRQWADGSAPGRRLAIAGCGLWIVLNVGTYGLYFFTATRFLLPLLAIATIGTAVGIDRSLDRLRQLSGRQLLPSMLLLALVAVGGVSWWQRQRWEPARAPRERRQTASHVRTLMALGRSPAAAARFEFDPVYAQALGLLPERRRARLGSWGLPGRDTSQLMRLRGLGCWPLLTSATATTMPILDRCPPAEASHDQGGPTGSGLEQAVELADQRGHTLTDLVAFALPTAVAGGDFGRREPPLGVLETMLELTVDGTQALDLRRRGLHLGVERVELDGQGTGHRSGTGHQSAFPPGTAGSCQPKRSCSAAVSARCQSLTSSWVSERSSAL